MAHRADVRVGDTDGATTLALAMYAACATAEKTARPVALKDIGRILRDSSWSSFILPSEITRRLFL
jgi:hypothetical protein